jgi:YD repeat-containing protein
VDRVETSSGAYGSLGYSYDLHGNMTAQGSDTFTYDPLTLRMATRNGQAITSNNNGSIVAEGGALYTYTARNQMATASVNGAYSTYKYDADEWRVMKVTPDGATTYYVRDAQGRLLSEVLVTAAGTESRREYVYAGARLIAVLER